MTFNKGCCFAVSSIKETNANYDASSKFIDKAFHTPLLELASLVLMHRLLAAGHHLSVIAELSDDLKYQDDYIFDDKTQLLAFIPWLKTCLDRIFDPAHETNIHKIKLQVKDCSVHAARDSIIDIEDGRLVQHFPGILLSDSQYYSDLLFEQYCTLHKKMIFAEPEVYINELALELTEKQMAFIVKTGGYSKQFQEERSIIEQIESRALTQPERPAIVFQSQVLNYGQLNNYTNALANQLYKSGIRKGEVVPILMEDVSSLIISIVALMKLEAPFVICDAKWPIARRERLLNKIEAKNLLVIEDEALADKNVEVICLHYVNLRNLDYNDALEYQRAHIHGDDALYGFFTSGTTGFPKCCINTQKGLLNRFNNMSLHLNLSNQETVLVNSNMTFDSALWQILWPLSQGARIVLPTEAQRRDARETLILMGKYDVVMTDFVPSIFRLLVQLVSSEQEMRDKIKSARYIIVGGEKVNTNCVQRFYQHIPDTVLMNTYGPTEASIGMMFYKIPRDLDDIPLGSPISNTYAVIVNKKNELCPPGVMGEIIIGGVCLGKGYINEPEKVEEVFIDNSFSWIPGNKLYRTGDFGYLRLDGCFQFVTRINDCVKVNGVMVNLSEIEETIKENPHVSSACVIVSSQGTMNLLCAYVIAQDNIIDTDPIKEQLKNHLLAQLPTTSIPKTIIFKDKFPLSPNGKIDRSALVAELNLANTENNKKVFDCHIKNTIYQVISEQIKIYDLSGDINLLDVGMDSVSAQMIRFKLENQLNKRLPIETIFSCSTINGLADFFKGERPTNDNQYAELIQDDLNRFDKLDFISEKEHKKGILITGGAGFVGAHLLAQLIFDLNPEENIFAIVRAEDDEHAMTRLAKSFHQYHLDKNLLCRVKVVAGDISEMNWGCSPGRLAEIFSNIDRVVLNGAHVNMLLGYDRLRTTNVFSIIHFVELMKLYGSKEILYISSLAIFNTLASMQERIPEVIKPQNIPQPSGGYAQSKWVAENLLERARQAGLNICIVRIGEILLSAATGADNQNSFFNYLTKLTMQLGCMPNTEAKLAYTPIDFVANVLSKILICENRTLHAQNYHVFGDKTVALKKILSQIAENKDLINIDWFEFAQKLESISDPKLDAIKSRVLAILNRFQGNDPLKFYFSDSNSAYCQNQFKKHFIDNQKSVKHDKYHGKICTEPY